MEAEKGHLTGERLEGLLKALGEAKYTGVLALWDDESWKEFYFANTGVRVTSIGARKVLPLGEYLVRRAFVGKPAVDKALQEQQTKMTMLGEILVDKEELEPERRDKAVRWQIEDELADLWAWSRPHFEFRAGPQSQQYSVVQRKRAETNTKSTSLNLPVPDLIRASRELAEELRELHRDLQPTGVYRLTELGRQKLFVKGGFKALSDPEQRIVVLIDGKRTLDEIRDRAVVLPNDTLRIMLKLVKYGAVKRG